MIAILLALLAVVNTPATSVSYACDGSTAGPYVITFPYLAYTDLVVTSTTAGGVVTTLVYSTDFTVSATSTTSTATLTLNNPASKCPVGSVLKITRTVALTQPKSFNAQTTYDPKFNETVADRTEMQVQQLQRQIDVIGSGDGGVALPILDEGVSQGAATSLNCVGDAITCTVVAGAGAVTDTAPIITKSYNWTSETFVPDAGNVAGVSATGHGTGHGGDFVGGTNSKGVQATGSGFGVGLAGTGGASGADGVDGIATLNQWGVWGQGGTTGIGVVGWGGSVSGDGAQGIATSGNGGTFTGGGAGIGVKGTGGPTGIGVSGVGGATSGDGVRGVGGGTNAAGVSGVGFGGTYVSPGPVGCYGTGGTNSLGGYFTGGATNGGGIQAFGTGTGVGVYAAGGGTGGVGLEAHAGVNGVYAAQAGDTIVTGGAIKLVVSSAPVHGHITFSSNTSTAPSAPSTGDLYYDTSLDNVRLWNSNAWESMVSVSATGSWTPGSVAAGTVATTNLTIDTGAARVAAGMACSVGLPSAPANALTYSCVAGTNLCTLVIQNASAGALTGISGTYRCQVFKP